VLVSDFEFPLCFGGLVSDGLRLSGTLRPTVGKGGGWLGKVARTVPVSGSGDWFRTGCGSARTLPCHFNS